jgi:hypothetical protein
LPKLEINRILRQTSQFKGSTSNKTDTVGMKINETINADDLAEYTKNVKVLGKEWRKAVTKSDVLRVNQLVKAMDNVKQIKKNIAAYKELKKRIDEAIDKQDIENVRKYSKEVKKLESETKQLRDEFNDLTTSQNYFTKKWADIKDGVKDFATVATAAGFLGNALRNVDKASVYTRESLLNMGTDEVAKQVGDLNFGVTESTGAVEKFGRQIVGSSVAFVKLRKETGDAIGLQNDLRDMVVATGKDLDELGQTALTVMDKFRLTLKDNREEIARATKDITMFGQVMGIGTSEATDFFEKKVKHLGSTVTQATKDMAGMAEVSNEIRQEFKGVSISTKDITHAVLNASNADVRSSQNIRIKTQLMKDQLAVSLQQGKTSEDAMKAAEGAANALSKSTDVVENITELDIAGEFKGDAKELKGLTEGTAEYEEKFAEVGAKYLKGITDPKELENAKKRLQRVFKDVNTGVITDTISLGKVLNDELGSQEVMMSKKYDKMRDLYKGVPLEVFAKQLSQSLGVDDKQARDIARNYQEAWKEGKTYTQFVNKSMKADLTQADTITNIMKGIENANKAIASSSLGNIINSVKSLINNPVVSAGIGLAAAGASVWQLFYARKQTGYLKTLAEGGGVQSGALKSLLDKKSPFLSKLAYGKEGGRGGLLGRGGNMSTAMNLAAGGMLAAGVTAGVKTAFNTTEVAELLGKTAESVTALDRIQAGSASLLSGLTGGMLDAKTISGGLTSAGNWLGDKLFDLLNPSTVASTSPMPTTPRIAAPQTPQIYAPTTPTALPTEGNMVGSYSGMNNQGDITFVVKGGDRMVSKATNQSINNSASGN